MTQKENRVSVVVDASIAQAAGGKDATNNTSQRCRDLLNSIDEKKINIVMTPSIADEWTKHKSKFSRKWLKHMYGKKYVTRILEGDLLTNDNTRNIMNATRKKIKKTCTAQEVSIGEKDLLLIEGAVSTDKIVFSLDDMARNIFVKVAQDSKYLDCLQWINPKKNDNYEIMWVTVQDTTNHSFCLAK